MAGDFTCAGGQVVNHIAHWDGSSWDALGSGLNIEIGRLGPAALALDRDGNLYVAGEFANAGGIQVMNIAKWTGIDWEAVGEGLAGGASALIIDSQDNLYAGGYFYIPGSVPSQHSAISRWDGKRWEAFGAGINNTVEALAFDGQGRLIAGGHFTATSDVPASGIARWNGEAWEALAENFSDQVLTVLIDGDTVYAGGNGIWKFQDNTFATIGGGVSSPIWTKAFVNAMALDGKGRLVIGGGFEKAGTVVANNIARWDGQRWASFGSGLGNGAIFVFNFDASGRLVVAGGFSLVGGKVSRNLAIWNEPFYRWLPVVEN